MKRLIRLALGAGAVLGLSAWLAPIAASAQGSWGGPPFGYGANHVVFVQTDNVSGNQVVAYDLRRQRDSLLCQHLQHLRDSDGVLLWLGGGSHRLTRDPSHL